jgi:hypothetical protein
LAGAGLWPGTEGGESVACRRRRKSSLDSIMTGENDSDQILTDHRLR